MYNNCVFDIMCKYESFFKLFKKIESEKIPNTKEYKYLVL
jgi:hypothetical protein